MMTSLPPAITISKSDARRFMLSHHGLYPPRQRLGKAGVLDYIHHVGCIQFDPINIVGRNPDLVLQSRVKDYRPHMLDELLYSDRNLLDGWDKMASIYAMEDWPNFTRRREWLREHIHERRPPQEALADTLEQVRQLLRVHVERLDVTEIQREVRQHGFARFVVEQRDFHLDVLLRLDVLGGAFGAA